jgi:hypothetical protein
MSALHFINKTSKTKFKGSFFLDSTQYEYTMYLLPITKQKEFEEIVEYFGTRMFKGKTCLDVTEEKVEQYILNDDVSAFIIVNPKGVNNKASGTLQIYDWCINPPSPVSSSSKSKSNSKSKSKSKSKSNSKSNSNSKSKSNSKSNSFGGSPTQEADVWINDVCRVSNSGNVGNPLKALFYFMEQLVVQNLGKTNIKLYIEPEPDNVAALKPKYESLGFIKNLNDNPDICPNWAGKEIVMEKSGLTPDLNIDFSFLQSRKSTRSVRSVTRRTTAKGIKPKHKKHKRKTRKQ